MTTLEDIQDYFEDLCTKHKDILHNTDDRKAFARLRSDDEITQLKKKATPNIVVIAEATGQRIGDVDAGEMRWGISIIFASQASKAGNYGSAVDTAINKAIQIMFDFVSRMQNDMNEDCPMQSLEVEKVSWTDIEGPWLDFYFGWMLFIPFKTDTPIYNADNWTS